MHALTDSEAPASWRKDGITDSNLTFRPLPIVGNVKVGHFLPPISLEHMTSSNFVYYMERSPQFDAFINRFDYVNGVTAFDSYFDDRLTLAGALVGSGTPPGLLGRVEKPWRMI